MSFWGLFRTWVPGYGPDRAREAPRTQRVREALSLKVTQGHVRAGSASQGPQSTRLLKVFQKVPRCLILISLPLDSQTDKLRQMVLWEERLCNGSSSLCRASISPSSWEQVIPRHGRVGMPRAWLGGLWLPRDHRWPLPRCASDGEGEAVGTQSHRTCPESCGQFRTRPGSKPPEVQPSTVSLAVQGPWQGSNNRRLSSVMSQTKGTVTPSLLPPRGRRAVRHNRPHWDLASSSA